MTVTYLTVNIEYIGTTFCVGCRHATYRFDVHYWCMRCTLLAGYWPCTAEKRHAACPLCQKLPSTARTAATKLWHRLYKDGALQYLLADGSYRTLERAAGVRRFTEERRTRTATLENAVASYFVLPGDVGLVEFHSKANTLDGNSMKLIEEATNHASANCKALCATLAR